MRSPFAKTPTHEVALPKILLLRMTTATIRPATATRMNPLLSTRPFPPAAIVAWPAAKRSIRGRSRVLVADVKQRKGRVGWYVSSNAYEGEGRRYCYPGFIGSSEGSKEGNEYGGQEDDNCNIQDSTVDESCEPIVLKQLEPSDYGAGLQTGTSPVTPRVQPDNLNDEICDTLNQYRSPKPLGQHIRQFGRVLSKSLQLFESLLCFR